MTRSVTLYGTSGCHLCEEARELIDRYAVYTALQVHEADVLEHFPDTPELQERIPFLESEQIGSRLFWPFDTADLHQWLQGGMST
ncbi:glutaredoxin family protein [Halorhodospira halophila]|uniref:Glutaredoxin 2 n=1 Tax=Halorhodospira halophila (strain DSM 244 / SL1) TaxID=349124 RepID=A1WT93_HALHL|nr:glutaredoxin family protein [Halorhodospira halophila]ABM60905.1 glutaredoxin 2 [Halorhodospira halophila SL1]MBK1728563.1 glutaredoxin family protein [Halorhodospira halophila]